MGRKSISSLNEYTASDTSKERVESKNCEDDITRSESRGTEEERSKKAMTVGTSKNERTNDKTYADVVCGKTN
jgi:hypothetical protein